MFDMDGLLLDTERLQLDCFVAARRNFGLSDSPETFLACIGLRVDKSAHIIQASIGVDADYRAFCDHWDLLCKTALADGVPLRPGVETLLQLLNQRGLPIGIATSSKTEVAKHHLTDASILRYFNVVVGGDMVDAPKPHPQIYYDLATALGVEPADCVVFEDSETGTRAAIASGATTIQVPDMIPPSDALKKLGHLIAPSLLDGAVGIGLIERSEIAAL
jgi:HAD superfamily hydrolase (TIGR01509 family)